MTQFSSYQPPVPALSRQQRLELLHQARVYLCTDARTQQSDLADFLRAAYRGGVDIIQLRDKTLPAREEVAALEVLARIAREEGKLFSVNDRADLALLLNADIFHVGQEDLTTAQARAVLGEEVLIGRSTNTPQRVLDAASDTGLDYFCSGPVWETPTKPGRAAVGTELVSFAAEQCQGKPFFAIGGIDLQRLPVVLEAGAERIVVVRAITEASDPAAAATQLRAAFTS